jgi:hypothetical protein
VCHSMSPGVMKSKGVDGDLVPFVLLEHGTEVGASVGKTTPSRTVVPHFQVPRTVFVVSRLHTMGHGTYPVDLSGSVNGRQAGEAMDALSPRLKRGHTLKNVNAQSVLSSMEQS